MQRQFKHHPYLFKATQKFKSRWHVKDKWQLFLVCPHEQKAVYDIWNQGQNYQDVEAKERIENFAFAAADHELHEVVHCDSRSEKEKGDYQIG